MASQDPENPYGDDPVELPLDGILDLHAFLPKDVRDVVESYLEACREKGVLDVQIIHGKGIGSLRRTVHTLLDRLPYVQRWWTPDEASGGWGATYARLLPAGENAPAR